MKAAPGKGVPPHAARCQRSHRCKLLCLRLDKPLGGDTDEGWDDRCKSLDSPCCTPPCSPPTDGRGCPAAASGVLQHVGDGGGPWR